MGAESGQRLFNALLVANVCVDAIKQREPRLISRNMQTGVSHQSKQAHRLERNGLATRVRSSYQQHPVFFSHIQADRNNLAEKQWMPRRRQMKVSDPGLAIRNDRRSGPRLNRISTLGHG